MVAIVGHLGDTLPQWHAWARHQPVSELLRSRYARGRREAYYGLGVTLGKQPHIYEATADARVHALGQQWLPGWHSALLCQYSPGTGINPHRDHSCFQPWAIMVNLGQAEFIEYAGRDRVVTPLADGVVVRINTKLLHGVLPVAQERYSLTFRHLKPAYLEPQAQLTFEL